MIRSRIRTGGSARRVLLAALGALLALHASCGSPSTRQRTPAGHVLTLIVQPEGVWREDSLGVREGPLEEVTYAAEYAALHVLLEGGEEKELSASLAVVRVTREGRLYLDQRLVAEGVRGVRVTEEGVEATGRDVTTEQTAGWIEGGLVLLAGCALLGLLLLGAEYVDFHNPWGPD